MEIQIREIIFQMINFGVVFGALTFLMYKPIKKMLADRSQKIEDAQKAAELTLAEKRHIDELKKKAQKAAEKEAADVIEKAVEDAKAKEQELLAQAKKKAATELEKAKMAWEDERAALVEDMKKEFVDTVIATAGKVVGSLDKKAHAKLIDEQLKDLVARL